MQPVPCGQCSSAGQAPWLLYLRGVCVSSLKPSGCPVDRLFSPHCLAAFPCQICLSSRTSSLLCLFALPFGHMVAHCRYGLNWRQALKACMQRELKLVYRDRFNLYSRTFQITYLAFLSATLFIKPGHDTVQEGQLFLLEIFFAALISTFAGFGKV